MITINRNLVLATALAATALVGAFATSGNSATHPQAIDQVAQRFPLPTEMFTSVPLSTYIAPKFIAAQKAVTVAPQRPTRAQSCATTPNGWPYVTNACLVG